MAALTSTNSKGATLAALVLLALAFFVGCGETSRALIITDADKGREVSLKVGQELLVELSGNATTGYSWTAAAPEKVLQETAASEYLSDPNPTNLAGVGGRQKFHFKALQAGKETLKFEYHRPWEKNGKPAQTAQFEIVVN